MGMSEPHKMFLLDLNKDLEHLSTSPLYTLGTWSLSHGIVENGSSFSKTSSRFSGEGVKAALVVAVCLQQSREKRSSPGLLPGELFPWAVSNQPQTLSEQLNITTNSRRPHEKGVRAFWTMTLLDINLSLTKGTAGEKNPPLLHSETISFLLITDPMSFFCRRWSWLSRPLSVQLAVQGSPAFMCLTHVPWLEFLISAFLPWRSHAVQWMGGWIWGNLVLVPSCFTNTSFAVSLILVLPPA